MEEQRSVRRGNDDDDDDDDDDENNELYRMIGLMLALAK